MAGVPDPGPGPHKLGHLGASLGAAHLQPLGSSAAAWQAPLRTRMGDVRKCLSFQPAEPAQGNAANGGGGFMYTLTYIDEFIISESAVVANTAAILGAYSNLMSPAAAIWRSRRSGPPVPGPGHPVPQAWPRS